MLNPGSRLGRYGAPYLAIDAEYRVMSPASLTLSLNEMPGNRSNHGPLVSNMLTPLGLAKIDF